MVNKELRIHNLPREWTSCWSFLPNQIQFRKKCYVLAVSRGGRPPYKVGTKQTVCVSGVTILHACTPSLHLGAGSIWHDGLGAGQALWHTARSFQFNVSSSSPPPPRKSQRRQLRRSIFGLDAWKAWVRTDSTPSPQRNEQSAGELEVRVKAFVFYSMEKRLSWAVMGMSAWTHVYIFILC